MNISSNELFLKNGKDPTLTVTSAGDALQVFVNGHSSGEWTNACLIIFLTKTLLQDFILWTIFLASVAMILFKLSKSAPQLFKNERDPNICR